MSPALQEGFPHLATGEPEGHRSFSGFNEAGDDSRTRFRVRLQALIGWLGNYGHVPYAKIRELLFELGQIDIGEGTLVATNERVAVAIDPPVEALGTWVKNEQPNIHVDETPWSVKGVKEWLWVVANKTFCLFHAADTRSPVYCPTRLRLVAPNRRFGEPYSGRTFFGSSAKRALLPRGAAQGAIACRTRTIIGN